MKHSIRKVLLDSRGAAAIEFALLLPLLFTLHIAAAEVLQAYKAQRNAAHIAAAIADITAQSRTLTTAEIDDILAASAAMMHPFPTVRLQQRVASLSASDSGAISVDWQKGKDYSQAGGPSVPPGYLLPKESVIVTDVIYDYQPTFGLFLPKTIRFTRHAYARPRLSAKVERL